MNADRSRNRNQLVWYGLAVTGVGIVLAFFVVLVGLVVAAVGIGLVVSAFVLPLLDRSSTPTGGRDRPDGDTM